MRSWCFLLTALRSPLTGCQHAFSRAGTRPSVLLASLAGDCHLDLPVAGCGTGGPRRASEYRVFFDPDRIPRNSRILRILLVFYPMVRIRSECLRIPTRILAAEKSPYSDRILYLLLQSDTLKTRYSENTRECHQNTENTTRILSITNNRNSITNCLPPIPGRPRAVTDGPL